MSKTKFETAKLLIQEKRYEEARIILKTIDHPTARDWEKRLDKIAPAQVNSSPIPKPAKVKVGFERMWRVIWGILTLLSLTWMCYGIFVASNTYTQLADPQKSESYRDGLAIGTSLGMAGYICIGAPFFVLFAVLYWRNGVAIRSAKQHAEMLNAVQTR